MHLLLQTWKRTWTSASMGRGQVGLYYSRPASKLRMFRLVIDQTESTPPGLKRIRQCTEWLVGDETDCTYVFTWVSSTVLSDKYSCFSIVRTIKV